MRKLQAAQERALEARLEAVDARMYAKLESAALARIENALRAAELTAASIETRAAAPDAPRLLRF